MADEEKKPKAEEKEAVTPTTEKPAVEASASSGSKVNTRFLFDYKMWPINE